MVFMIMGRRKVTCSLEEEEGGRKTKSRSRKKRIRLNRRMRCYKRNGDKLDKEAWCATEEGGGRWRGRRG